MENAKAAAIFANRRIILRRGGSLARLAIKLPVGFYEIVDDKLVIIGALAANSYADGLYIDCEPAWSLPVQNGNVLTIEQVYAATQNGNVLEVE